MPDIQLVLADLDGTIVYPDSNELSNVTTDALTKAKSKGIKFAAVSGRPYWQAKPLLRALGFNGPCILEGGGVIMDPMSGDILMVKASTSRNNQAGRSDTARKRQCYRIW
jgi:hydroxymethylpyrimidine pyrophosphatase-like HAD family hydrolase